MNTEPTQTQPVRITLTMPTNAYFMSGVRDFTLSIARNFGNLSNQWAYRLQSVVDELCNNAIEFGSNRNDEISVTFIYTPEKSIDIIVEDHGTGKMRTTAAELQRIVREKRAPGHSITEIRGRGLATIASEWTDELRFEDRPGGGLRITARKYINNTTVTT